ncbi:MAG: hypothetical protein WC563_15515 [Brevundimonas sp.]
MPTDGFPFPTTSPRPTNGPPAETEVPAGQLFRKLTDTVRAHEILPFPRNNDDGQPCGEYWLQVLVQTEVDDAQIDAEKYVRRRAKERAKALGESPDEAAEKPNQEAWRDIFQSALMVELIFHAARCKEDASKPLFRCPDDIRDTCTPNEITSITNSYDQVQRRYGPLFKTLSAEDTKAWIERLVKGGEEALGPFGLLSPGEMAQLIHSLAYHWPCSPTGKFLVGWQSDDGTETTSSQPLVDAPSEPEFRED